MLKTTEPFVNAHKAQLELLRSAAANGLDNVEQVVALNLKAAKAGLDDVAEASRAALAARDPRSLWAAQSSLLQPAAQKANAYGREVIELLAGARAEFDKVAAAQAAVAQSLKTAFEAAGANLQAFAAPAPKSKRG
jgi:phasin family protein